MNLGEPRDLKSRLQAESQSENTFMMPELKLGALSAEVRLPTHRVTALPKH